MFCRDGKGERCPREATVRLLDPDGKRVPGGGMCDAHAREVVTEYREKLGEEWRVEPLEEQP